MLNNIINNVKKYLFAIKLSCDSKAIKRSRVESTSSLSSRNDIYALKLYMLIKIFGIEIM